MPPHPIIEGAKARIGRMRNFHSVIERREPLFRGRERFMGSAERSKLQEIRSAHEPSQARAVLDAHQANLNSLESQYNRLEAKEADLESRRSGLKNKEYRAEKQILNDERSRLEQQIQYQQGEIERSYGESKEVHDKLSDLHREHTPILDPSLVTAKDLVTVTPDGEIKINQEKFRQYRAAAREAGVDAIGDRELKSFIKQELKVHYESIGIAERAAGGIITNANRLGYYLHNVWPVTLYSTLSITGITGLVALCKATLFSNMSGGSGSVSNLKNPDVSATIAKLSESGGIKASLIGLNENAKKFIPFKNKKNENFKQLGTSSEDLNKSLEASMALASSQIDANNPALIVRLNESLKETISKVNSCLAATQAAKTFLSQAKETVTEPAKIKSIESWSKSLDTYQQNLESNRKALMSISNLSAGK